MLDSILNQNVQCLECGRVVRARDCEPDDDGNLICPSLNCDGFMTIGEPVFDPHVQ